jgi:hypothetical protein
MKNEEISRKPNLLVRDSREEQCSDYDIIKIICHLNEGEVQDPYDT